MANNSTIITTRLFGSNTPVIEKSSLEPRNGFGGDAGSEAVDAAFVILSTFIIFTMQSGFGLLESGKIIPQNYYEFESIFYSKCWLSLFFHVTQY